jgi:glycerol-3-phosphate dehydrogenase
VDRYFEKAPVADDVLYSFSGVRPLYDDKAANPSAVTRDYVFDIDAPVDAAPMLSIFGGKITTYRKLAEHALEKLAPFFPDMTGDWTHVAPMPGGDIPDADFDRFHSNLQRNYPWLSAEICFGYARRYGSRVEALLNAAHTLEDLGRHFGATLYEREARFLIENEWATTAEDILQRRTKHGLHLTSREREEFENWLTSLSLETTC